MSQSARWIVKSMTCSYNFLKTWTMLLLVYKTQIIKTLTAIFSTPHNWESWWLFCLTSYNNNQSHFINNISSQFTNIHKKIQLLFFIFPLARQ